MTICLVDTGILLNVLNISGKNQQRKKVVEELDEFIDQRHSLLLPVAAIIETGNHIAQLGDGNSRRRCATSFAEQIAMAIDGEAPWSPARPLEPSDIRAWLKEYPDCAMRGIGLADLSIIKEWQRQQVLSPRRRVFIWSLDNDLAGYDTGPRTSGRRGA